MCLKSLVGVTRTNIVKNEVRGSFGIEKEFSSSVDQRTLHQCMHVKRMNEQRMAKRLMSR